jgi:hypothetical protein
MLSGAGRPSLCRHTHNACGRRSEASRCEDSAFQCEILRFARKKIDASP